MSGILYGVSVGPGDKELITLKAVRFMETSEIIAVPRTKGENTMALSIVEQTMDLSQKTIIYVDFLMTRDQVELNANYDRITETLVPYLDAGKNIAMLTIGDLSVYSTFSYICERVTQKGYTVEICPGVPSFCDMAAKLQKPLVAGSEALVIVSADNPHLDQLMEMESTKVIMKGGRRLEQMCDYLTEKGVADTTYIAKDIGLPTEHINPLKECSIEEKSYFTTILVK